MHTIINFIRANVVNTCIFKVLCDKMGSGHTSLHLNTHVKWLSREKVLTCIFDFKTKLEIFLKAKKSPFGDFCQHNIII